MLQVDFHSHSHFSRCGVHSIIEMLTRARDLGMQGLAITDHGPTLNSSIPSPFFDRLHNPVEGIRLLKGMECNVLPDGGIDFPPGMMKWVDVILLGIHPNIEAGKGVEWYTQLLITAMKRHPWVDVITHINDATYQVDADRIATVARELNIAVELNNSKTALARTEAHRTHSLISACKSARCRIAVCSDAHTLNEIGCDEAVRPLLEASVFPPELVVNGDAAAGFLFVEQRKENRRVLTGLSI